MLTQHSLIIPLEVSKRSVCSLLPLPGAAEAQQEAAADGGRDKCQLGEVAGALLFQPADAQSLCVQSEYRSSSEHGVQ